MRNNFGKGDPLPTPEKVIWISYNPAMRIIAS